MQQYYLICKNCNGYYQLQDGESPEDFDICQCGGDLILTTGIFVYEDYESSYGEYEEYNKVMKVKKVP